jgi:hypothetical protein
VAVVATLVNEQVENIKKVYSEKMAKLDKDLSQKVKRHESEEKQMKYMITQLVKQKQELEDKLAKITPPPALITKPSSPPKPIHSLPNLKKPISSNVKFIPLKHSKEALTLKTPFLIKFNQIQIEKIETENFDTPTPRQGDLIQKEISEINKLEINTPSPLINKKPSPLPQTDIIINFPIPKPLSQTTFTATEQLPITLTADSLLVKRKRLGLSKHKIQNQNKDAFTFNKPSLTNPLEFIGIDKPKEVIKKNKPLNKNTEILEFFFEQKIDNNNNNKPKQNTKDIFDLKNIEYNTPPKIIPPIITQDSQGIVPSSAPFSHPSSYVESPSSPAIQSFVIDSNVTTQIFNILEIFELSDNTPISPILSEKLSQTT